VLRTTRRAKGGFSIAFAGKTWIAIPSTTRATTNVAASLAGTTVQFRLRSLTPRGQSNWIQATAVLVN
jgi:hypothetical protein